MERAVFRGISQLLLEPVCFESPVHAVQLSSSATLWRSRLPNVGRRLCTTVFIRRLCPGRQRLWTCDENIRRKFYDAVRSDHETANAICHVRPKWEHRVQPKQCGGGRYGDYGNDVRCFEPTHGVGRSGRCIARGIVQLEGCRHRWLLRCDAANVLLGWVASHGAKPG